MSGTKTHAEVNRLKADLHAAGVELLSAHCAIDRIRLKYSVHDIVAFGEHQALKRAIASAEALRRFFSQIEAHIKYRDECDHGKK